MAPSKKTTVVAKVASSSPYQLNSEQTLRATKALVKKIQSDVKTKSAAEKKESLLADFKRIHDPERARKFDFSGDFWEVEFDFVLARKPGSK